MKKIILLVVLLLVSCSQSNLNLYLQKNNINKNNLTQIDCSITDNIVKTEKITIVDQYGEYNGTRRYNLICMEKYQYNIQDKKIEIILFKDYIYNKNPYYVVNQGIIDEKGNIIELGTYIWRNKQW